MAASWEEIVSVTLRCRMGQYRRWPDESEQKLLTGRIVNRSGVRALQAISASTALMIEAIENEFTKTEFLMGLR